VETIPNASARLALELATSGITAAPGFWDDMTPDSVLALHDGGVMAGNVLAGRPAFDHRD
jgi:hypothetical protein